VDWELTTFLRSYSFVSTVNGRKGVEKEGEEEGEGERGKRKRVFKELPSLQ